jgi:hypothetical protein
MADKPRRADAARFAQGIKLMKALYSPPDLRVWRRVKNSSQRPFPQAGATIAGSQAPAHAHAKEGMHNNLNNLEVVI